MNAGKRKLIAEVKRRKLSVRRAALLAGCSKSAMQRYLDPDDDRVPEGELIFDVARAFGFEAKLFYSSRSKSKAA